MDEQEVLRKLGFESEAELLSVKQLAKYHPIYATDYFDLSIDEKETNDSIDRLSVDKTFLPIFYYSVYGRIMISGWRALLNTDYKNKVISINTKDHHESWIKEQRDKTDYFSVDNVMIDEKIPVYLNEQKKEIGRLFLKIDQGHVLGKFSNLLSYIENFLGNEQNINNIDIYPQFARANRNSKKDHGQVNFEWIITKHPATPFYYEAEAIFTHPLDKIPIGTRIKIITLEKTEDGHYQKSTDPDAIFEHVFIPNCDYAESDPASVLSSDNTAVDYRNFFKEGDLRALKWKNIDFQK